MALTQVPPALLTSTTGTGSTVVLSASPTFTGTVTTPGVTFSDASSQTAAASPYVLKNRIINGDMRIDQRNAGASVTPADNTYTLDRWKYNAYAASKFTCQQTPNATESGYATRVAAGFTNYMAWTVANAYTPTSFEYFIFNQRIEGYNIADLAWGTANAKTVTLSFLVYSSLTGTHSGAITNSAVDRSYPFSFVVSSANTWTQVSITIPGDTSGTWLTTNGIGVNVQFNLGSNANRLTTGGAWAAGTYTGVTGSVQVVTNAGATFYITGVQLEVGSTATPFERRLYGQELINCQRYYQIVGSFYAGTSPSETSLVGAYSMYVSMRASPSSGGYSANFHRPGIAFYTINSIDQLQNQNGSGYFVATISSGAGGYTQGQFNGTLNLNAEL
jgi:hypothetical protein